MIIVELADNETSNRWCINFRNTSPGLLHLRYDILVIDPTLEHSFTNGTVGFIWCQMEFLKGQYYWRTGNTAELSWNQCMKSEHGLQSGVVDEGRVISFNLLPTSFVWFPREFFVWHLANKLKNNNLQAQHITSGTGGNWQDKLVENYQLPLLVSR
jgi:hypothetical protein